MFIKAFVQVFRNFRCAVLWFISSVAVFSLAVWWPNLGLVWQIIWSDDIPLAARLRIPFSLLGSIATNFTPLSALYVIIISLLFGLNAALSVYYLRRRVREIKTSGLTLGFLGVIASLFSLGCAACGPLVITSILSLFGAAGLLTRLPMHGGEIGGLGLILLSVSIYLTGRQIANPSVCRARLHSSESESKPPLD